MTLLQTALLLGLLLALALAYLLHRQARTLRADTGLPKGRVVYVDTDQRVECAPLYAPRYGLAGKPDYLVKSGGEIIPVEVKPGRRAPQPYPSDVMQLAAYCLLVEETWGRRPSHGLLRYEEQTFHLPYDAPLRDALLATLAEMRLAFTQGPASRNHDDPRRCSHCGQREHCNQRLA